MMMSVLRMTMTMMGRMTRSELRQLPRTEVSQAHGIPPLTKAESLQYNTNIGGYSMVW